MHVDSLVINAKIVSPEGVNEGHIAVEKGKIAALLGGTSLPEAGQTFDRRA